MSSPKTSVSLRQCLPLGIGVRRPESAVSWLLVLQIIQRCGLHCIVQKSLWIPHVWNIPGRWSMVSYALNFSLSLFIMYRHICLQQAGVWYFWRIYGCRGKFYLYFVEEKHIDLFCFYKYLIWRTANLVKDLFLFMRCWQNETKIGWFDVSEGPIKNSCAKSSLLSSSAVVQTFFPVIAGIQLKALL